MHYGRLYDEQVADNYDRDALGLLRGVRDLGVGQILGAGRISDAVILDLGVGTGETLRALAPHAQGARMIGIDLSARMIDVARTKVTLEAHVDDACNAAAHVAAGTIDLTLAHFLTSFVDRDRLFTVARGTLKPGGLFSIVSTTHAAFGRIRKIVGGVLGTDVVNAAAPAPTEEQLAGEVRAAGFEIVATDAFRKPVKFTGFDEAVDWGLHSGFFTQSIDAIGLDKIRPFARIPGIFPIRDEYVGMAILARAI